MPPRTLTWPFSLPFSALRAVAAPCRDEHDDTLGLVSPHLADRTVLLLFAVRAPSAPLTTAPSSSFVR